MSPPIPVALFTYNRPDLLRRTLAALHTAETPLIYAFSDGARSPEHEEEVAEVRRVLRAVDWCEIVRCERPANLGLGVSIRTGVAEVLRAHEALLVFEDDLVCVPGTYRYLTAALRRYADEPRVMSVAAWNHPRVTPPDIGATPYFDGRAECWGWGTWRRAWAGMDRDAASLLAECARRRVDTYRYGADVPAMAAVEAQRNIWAVRWLLHHMVAGGLCLRPAQSMVEHIGFDGRATNSPDGSYWENPPLRPAPEPPALWPEPHEHRACPGLWQRACGGHPRPSYLSLPARAARRLLRMVRSLAP